VLLHDLGRGLLGHAGLGAQQIEAAAHLVELLQHVAGKVKAGYPLL